MTTKDSKDFSRSKKQVMLRPDFEDKFFATKAHQPTNRDQITCERVNL
jgi:hypothetical protein